MKIIGHRGVAGIELENTKGSFMRAMNIGLSAVELDVRKTKDNRLAVCHDSDLVKIAHRKEKVQDLTLKQLQDIQLIDGSTILSLEEALDILEGIEVIVETKDEGCGRELCQILKKYPQQSIAVASFILRELAVYQDLGIRNELYGLEHTKPFDIIHFAKIMRLQGIGLNFWLLNPLTYFLCRKANLKVYVYTVNNQFVGKLLGWLYPTAAICTDYPGKFMALKES